MGEKHCLYTKAASVLGIGYPEMMVLYALDTMEKLTQKQIAENFGMQKQTVHTVVSALQKKGYLLLEPSEGDKREKQIILTESGREYAHRTIAPLQKAEDKIYRTIGNDRLQAMCEILDLFNFLFERELSGGLEVMFALPPLLGGQIMIWWSAVFAKVMTAVISIVLTVKYGIQGS